VTGSPPSRSVLDRVRAAGVIDPDGKYLALVSGGRDSVCLLDILARCCRAGSVTVLHVNYGLRGADSEQDERHVRTLCELAGAELHVHRSGPPPGSGNLQAWARDVRYGEASRLALALGARVAVGHTASDQAETVLYRLASSPGRRALLGMGRSDGLLVRPLLCITRAETAAYCASRALAFRDDASNEDDRFARGRVRHGLLEELRRVHPAAEANVVRTAELLRDEAAVLDSVLSAVLAGRAAIPLAELGALDAAVARLVVVRLAEDAAGTLVPGVAARLTDILGLAPDGGSARVDLGARTRAVVEYGVLRFELATAVTSPSRVVLAVPGRARFGRWTVDAEVHELSGERGLAWRAADGSVGVLDADELDLDALSVRSWRPGDRVRPIGLDGSKTLADLFTDRRLARGQRTTTPVVACGGDVVWVPGVATAERVALRERTRRVAVLRAVRE